LNTDEDKKQREQRQQDEKDLRLMRKMKQLVDKGYDVELKKDKQGEYKALRVDKRIITTE